MTTNHRPTFESRRGREISTNIVHKRALPAHKQLKYRKERQALDELKKELLEREQQPSGKEAKSLEGPKADEIDTVDEEEEELTYEKRSQKVLEEFKSVDDSSDESNGNASDSDSDDDDDHEELLRELEKLKREKAAKAQQASLVANPLLDPHLTSSTKKNWRQSAIFKNTSTQKQAKDHVNDMLRSEFHTKFMQKYFK